MARFEFTCLYGHDRVVEVPTALVDNYYDPGAKWMLQGIAQNMIYYSKARGNHPCSECERKLNALIEHAQFQRVWGPKPGVCSICGGPTPCLRQD